MTIEEFIRESVLRPRLSQSGCLVVYDPERRYHAVCAKFADDTCRFIDASDSSIESREAAQAALCEIGRVGSSLQAALIYVPTARPLTDEAKQIDPFAFYAECGAVFPRDDGDDYLSLCLRAKPSHTTQVRQVFADAPAGPKFAVIDAIGTGASWPQLRAALGVEASGDTLLTLLAPSKPQQDALKDQEGWNKEARAFLLATVGLKLKTRSKGWSPLADELWRYVLFSEFALDLPEPLPEGLQGVPHASASACPVVFSVCDRLRNNPDTRPAYVERAQAIQTELNLPSACGAIEEFGQRDTFPFEERALLATAIQAVVDGKRGTARTVLAARKHSVWLGQGENQAQWTLVGAGLDLIEACDDFERQLGDHVRLQTDLIDFYVASLREVDRLQRDFEQAVVNFLNLQDLLDRVIGAARARYGKLMQEVQAHFMRHLERSGWPPPGRLANTDVFDHLIAGSLKENHRKVAFLMVDALRYELGVDLGKRMAEDGPVDVQAAYAQFPTITLVGMASLLPGAKADLSLALEKGALTPKLAGVAVTNVAQRMNVLAKRYGDRFQEMQLGAFVRGKPKIAPTVDLLVLRSTEIDSQLESNPESALSLIPGTVQLIRAALHKLRGMGFQQAVIATDHGFFLNAHAQAGDVCAKPQGNWMNAHDRMLLGSGSADAHSVVVGAEKVGVRGDFAQVAMPRSMAPYASGHLYFHGGASLAEAIVPVLIARLDAKTGTEQPSVRVELRYKNGAKRITTQRPVIEVALTSDDMFAQATGVEVLLEAQDGKGEVVGEPRPGGEVNPATGTVTLMPGERKQIALRMAEEFRGKFKVLARNPTTLATYEALALETDYTE